MRDERTLLGGDESYEMYVKAFGNAFVNLGYNVWIYITDENWYRKRNDLYFVFLLWRNSLGADRTSNIYMRTNLI